MFNNDNFRKKYLLPISYCGVLALALWSGSSMISGFGPAPAFTSSIEPAAGEEAAAVTPSDAEMKSATELDSLSADAKEETPLRISPDKPEVIQLDRDAVNVLVGSDETLRAVPDTNRSIILIPKKPGATFFKAIDADGKIIMQRHVIVGSAERVNKYVRIRRACAQDDKGCQEFSMYYCPDVCHEVNVVQGDKASQSNEAAPSVAPSVQSSTSTDTTGTTEYIEPTQPAPSTSQ